MADENLEITPDDLQELMRINPLGAEQLKNIALRRRLADAERKLAEATGTHLPHRANGKDATEATGS